MNHLQMLASSHSPLIGWSGPSPAGDTWEHAVKQRRQDLEAFDPQLVISIAVDHYTAMRYDLVAPFVIGTAGRTVDDFGGHEGVLDVPGETARDLITAVTDAGFDPAVSHHLATDHGTSNALVRFLGAVDARPTIPIIVSAITEPRPTLRRCRLFGEAIGHWAVRRSERILVLASGGLSHDPTILFPPLGTDPSVDPYLLRAGAPHTLDDWLARIDQLSRLGGQLLADEAIAADIRPRFDRSFLEAYSTADPSIFDTWELDDIVRDGAPGALEVTTWVIARAAALTADLPAPVIDHAAAVPEFGVGLALTHAHH
jgi:2,3-dihydroxyphenylpropionate 1,2-dioxygenase